MESTIENNKILDQFNDNYLVNLNGFECYYNKENRSYHNDWNLLMEVVEKIESIFWEDLNDTSFNVTIGATRYCVIQDNNGGVIEIIGEGESKIQSVYNACLEFIKWYNEQKSA